MRIFKKRRFNLQATIILLVCCSTLVSLVVSAILVKNFITETNYETVSEKIVSIAKIVSKNEVVVDGLIAGDPEQSIQAFTEEVMHAANLDFVVVFDTKGIRLSHTDPSYIGKPFSNLEDVNEVLAGQQFFSDRPGILGSGYRYFTPVVSDNRIVGAVCVGLTTKSIDSLIVDAQKKIFFSLFLGLIIGVVGAIFLAQKLKKILLGLEPEEISAQLSEKEIIENEVHEGIIAISPERKVIMMNKEAKVLFEDSNLDVDLLIGESLDENLYEVLFKKTIEKHEVIRNQAMYLNGIEVIASASPIFSENQFFGAVATLKNQSELLKLLDELGGTEQYINSLRAQTHEFLNKLHVISGLIDLQRYDEVSTFIQQLNSEYTAEVGEIIKLIKVPAIAGFLLGKINEAKEQNVELIVAPDSYVPEMSMDDSVHALLQVLGNLIDNAKEAILAKGNEELGGQIRLHLKFEEDGQVFILEVCDDGIGINEAEIEQLQAVGFSTKGKNRGFGLSIVNKIITRYHGVIDFSAREAGGTTVYVEIPKKERE